VSELVRDMQKAAEGRIVRVRGQQVMLDSDLADFYGVPTGKLNEQAKLNQNRFPDDFRFQLTADEYAALLSENRIAKPGRGGRRTLPWVYTAKGVLAASGVVKSAKADEVAVAIPRAFEAMARDVAQLSGVLRRLEALEFEQVSRSDFNRMKREMLSAMKGLGDAVEQVEKRLPKGS
jgi:hypothetical protein